MSAAASSGAGVSRPEVARVKAFATRHALLLLIALGAVIRFATIGSQGFWLDEQVTVTLIQQSPVDLLTSVNNGESNPSLYYVLQGAWERIFGSGETGIRSFTALLGTASIPLMYGAAKALYSRRAGLIAAAFTATSPLLIWYSQEARNYEQLLFLSALALLCFARALDEYEHRWLWGWALAASLGLATHYFAIFLIVPQAAWLLYRRPGSKLDTALPMGSVAIVGLALLPLLAVQRDHGNWIDSYSLSGRLLNVPEQFLVGYQVPWKVVPTIAIALTIVLFVYIATRADARARRAMGIAGGLAVAGFAILMLAAAAGSDYILTRNLLELWPPIAAAIAIGLASPRVGRIGIVIATGICVIGTGLAIWNAATPDARRPSYSELAQALGDTPTSRLIVSQSSFSSPLILDGDGFRAASDAELTTSQLIVIEQRPSHNYAIGTCFWVDTCGGVDVEPPPPFEPPPGFELDRTGTTDSFAYSVYTAPEPVTIQRPLELYTPRVFIQEPS